MPQVFARFGGVLVWSGKIDGDVAGGDAAGDGDGGFCAFRKLCRNLHDKFHGSAGVGTPDPETAGSAEGGSDRTAAVSATSWPLSKSLRRLGSRP